MKPQHSRKKKLKQVDAWKMLLPRNKIPSYYFSNGFVFSDSMAKLKFTEKMLMQLLFRLNQRCGSPFRDTGWISQGSGTQKPCEYSLSAWPIGGHFFTRCLSGTKLHTIARAHEFMPWPCSLFWYVVSFQLEGLQLLHLAYNGLPSRPNLSRRNLTRMCDVNFINPKKI